MLHTNLCLGRGVEETRNHHKIIEKYAFSPNVCGVCPVGLQESDRNFWLHISLLRLCLNASHKNLKRVNELVSRKEKKFQLGLVKSAFHQILKWVNMLKKEEFIK